MSLKAFYPEEISAVRSVLQMPGRVFVVPQGETTSEIINNQRFIRDKLQGAGFSTQEKNPGQREIGNGHASYSVEVDTCNNNQVGIMVCRILGVVNKPASSIRGMH